MYTTFLVISLYLVLHKNCKAMNIRADVSVVGVTVPPTYERRRGKHQVRTRGIGL